MKKLFLLAFFLIIRNLAFFAQGSCSTDDAALARPYSPCGTATYTDYIPGSNVDIPVNFVFLKPLTGTGIFDTITKGTCDSIIMWMNYHWANLSSPTLPLPSPYTAPTGFTDTKIRFYFKSISHEATGIYKTVCAANQCSTNCPYPAYTAQDPTALNIVFNVVQGCGVAGKGASVGGVVRVNQDTSGFNLFNSGTKYMYFVHEVAHVLGLIHTNLKSNLSLYTNPTGTILGDPPFNDYWIEDTITFGNWTRPSYPDSANNWLGYTWPARTYLSPNQIGVMHRNLQTNPILRVWSDSQCPIPVNGIQLSSGTYNSVNSTGDIYIPTGSDVTLTGCVNMRAGAKIIVFRNARLTLSNCRITSDCIDPWYGIELFSAPQALQTIDPITGLPSGGAAMLVVSSSTIEGAQIGVNAGAANLAGQFSPSNGGGIIFSDNSVYLDNTIAVNFTPHYSLGPNGVSANISSFSNDLFYISKGYSNTVPPVAAINIHNTFKIKILGCTFTDYWRYTLTGIKCMNGSVIVKDDPITSKRNAFYGCRYGAYLVTQLMNYPSEFKHCIFNQRDSFASNVSRKTYGSIYLLNNFGSLMVNNDFMLRAPQNSTFSTYGIYLDNSDGYVVENNSFTGYTFNYIRTCGIFANNSGGGANSIYNNTFQYLTQGIWAQNINYDPVTGNGLLMNCDDFNEVDFSIGVQAQYISPCAGVGCPLPPLQAGGIRTVQGVASQGETDNVRNTYLSQNACVANNKYQVSTPNNFFLLHGSFPAGQYRPTPQPGCSDAAKVILSSGLPPANNVKTSFCIVNQYKESGNTELTTLASEQRSLMTSFSAELQAGTDDNNTAGLLSLIGSSPDPTYLGDVLLAAPFLSDTLLKAYFASPDTLWSFLTGIFEKNAPVSPSVWQWVPSLGLDAPTYSYWDSLQFKQNKLGPRMDLESRLNMAYGRLGLVQNEKVRRFLSDSAAPVYDSIAAIYKAGEFEAYKYKLVDLALACNRFDAASDLMDSLCAGGANEVFCTVQGYIRNLKQDTAYYEVMRADTNIHNYLVSHCSSAEPLTEGRIKALLTSVYDDPYAELELRPEGIEEEDPHERRSQSQAEALKEIKEDQAGNGFKIYPNPANGRVFIESAENKPVNLRVLNLRGEAVISSRFTGSLELDVNFLMNGVYFVNLSKADGSTISKKLVIIK